VPDSLEEVTLNVETTEPEPKPEQKAPVSPTDTIKKAIPKPASGPPGPAPAPAEFDEITDEEIEDIPWLLLIALILVAALAAGAIIFRHKLIAFWQAHTQQPAPEAEDART
jgi:hypothetical protein